MAASGTDDVLARLAEAPAERRQAMLVDFIERQLLEILQWDESRRPELVRGFLAIGLDSLMAIELQFRLQRALKFSAPPDGESSEFEMTSPADLAAFLLAERLRLA